jgi:uncharacterized protein
VRTTLVEKAQAGRVLIEEAILELLALHPEGLRNSEVAESLDLRSDYQGGQKDYLSWSILGLLLNRGAVAREGNKYVVNPSEERAENNDT